MKAFWLNTYKMTDQELADLIHELNNELNHRLHKYRGLKGQMEAASLKVRSWSSTKQQNLQF